MTPDTSDLILRSITELRDEVREGLRKLDTVVTGLDNRVRDLELWRAGQSSADTVARDLVERDHQERGLILSKKQVWIALGAVVVSALSFSVAIALLITTGHTQ